MNDEERQRYKQIFNKEYVDYLQLKESIDLISNQYQKDCSSLSERLDSVPQQSNEYKVRYCNTDRVRVIYDYRK